ncbi:MAG TPA: lysophospholipid acyltransferase family protein [Bauldia sp.]|nr:lysophospholipid acyltransferase family protein [Bauldia sp.]
MADAWPMRNALRRVVRRARDWSWPYVAAGKTYAAYMRFVRATSRITIEPGNPFEIFADRAPLILTTWHGQHFMVTLLMRPGDRASALVSRSNDGDASAAFLGSFGIEAVRGSGGRDRLRTVEKGGARALLQMRRSLDEGISIATVADVSNTVARHCGEGIIALARISGRPIVPMGFATSRWIAMRGWDKATIHLPFSRAALVMGELVDVPADADEATLENRRQLLEGRINACVDRAYEIVGKRRQW